MSQDKNTIETKEIYLKRDNDKYHHGDLKESLIQNGLKLLLEEGSQKFSLRKVAVMCNVSHAAPYKHFKNKEELIQAISEYVSSKFENSLLEVKENNLYDQIIEMGKKYVYFMVENYDCLNYLFFNNSSNAVEMKDNKIDFEKYKSFNIFAKCAKEYLTHEGIKKEEQTQDIIAMWAMVHGLSTMIANKNINYEGDYLVLVENILRKNMTFK